MRRATPIVMSIAVEGDVDESVARRIASSVGIEIGRVHGKYGKSFLEKKAQAYNNAARFAPWLLLVDLNHAYPCAPSLRRDWMPSSSPYMSFRVAVREIEAWIMADRERLAKFLQIPARLVPSDPEAIEHPKETLVQLAMQSRSRLIRQDMVPRPSGGRSVGPLYSTRLIEFVGNVESGWRLEAARAASRSCEMCVRDLEKLRDRYANALKR